VEAPAEREQIRREQEKSLAHQAQQYYLEKIIVLYRFYIADSIVGNWVRFITSVKEAKSKLKDKKISEASYNSFIEECSGKIGFDIVKLMGYGNYVDPIRCFGDSLTTQEQKDFLIFMENYEFQPVLKTPADVMLQQLATVTEFQVIPEFQTDTLSHSKRNKSKKKQNTLSKHFQEFTIKDGGMKIVSVI
jgi:hypothetical protein